MTYIDLHAHTTASDGTFTPTELISAAAKMGLAAITVTDHDTIDGLPEAFGAAHNHNIEFVPGIELSISYYTGRFHMLGFFIDWNNSTLANRLKTLKENRVRRNDLMVARMTEMGLPITLEDILAESGGGQVGRPHMAMAMVKKGLVNTLQEAFDKYLADGAMAHFPKDKITVEEGLDLIHTASGIAVLAHPGQLKMADDVLLADLYKLKEMGLDGMECYYNDHSTERTNDLLDMAKRVGLAVSGGSDFHGAAKPHVFLGKASNGEGVPANLLDGLKTARDARQNAHQLVGAR